MKKLPPQVENCDFLLCQPATLLVSLALLFVPPDPPFCLPRTPPSSSRAHSLSSRTPSRNPPFVFPGARPGTQAFLWAPAFARVTKKRARGGQGKNRKRQEKEHEDGREPRHIPLSSRTPLFAFPHTFPCLPGRRSGIQAFLWPPAFARVTKKRARG